MPVSLVVRLERLESQAANNDYITLEQLIADDAPPPNGNDPKLRGYRGNADTPISHFKEFRE